MDPLGPPLVIGPHGFIAVNTHVVHNFVMKREDPQFKIRLPPLLKTLLEDSASHNQRSIGAEIVSRLQQTFDAPTLIEADAGLRLRLAILEMLVKDDNFAKSLEDAAERVIRSGVDGSLPLASIRKHAPAAKSASHTDVKAGMSKAFDEVAQQSEQPAAGKGPKARKKPQR